MSETPSRPGRRWALASVFAALALAMVLGLGTSPPPAAAFGGLTDEAILVWQHRNPGALDYDIWYSALGRPSPSDPSSALTWHAAGGPVTQAAPIATFPGDDKNAHVSTNAGIAIAVWQHAPGTGSSPGDWEIFWSQLNTGTGLWSPPNEIAHLTGDDYDPNVTVDSNGNAVAVWVHENADGTRVIYYSVKTGSGWTPPAQIGPSPGDASLPEVSITAVTGGGPLQHKVVAVWADAVALTVHQMLYSVFDGASWTPPAAIPVPAPEIPDVGHSHYLGTDPDPFGAAGRDGITADALGNAYVMWGGGPIREGHGSVGVVGAIYDVAADTWAPMLTPFGGRLIGIGGCENPDIAMTTGTGDLVGVFNFAGFIEHTFRTGGAFTPESFSYDSELTDERPTDAGLSATELVAANWGADSFSGPFGPASDIIYGIGTVTPGVSVAFGGAAHVVPDGLPGEDAFPEIASFFAGAIIEPGLSLSPASDTNPVGTPHTVTATVTADGEPQEGVLVHFEVTGSGGSIPTPPTGDCVTGPDGTCTFTYTSPTEGDDLITATATIAGQQVTATATKKWVALPVELQGRMTGGAFIDDPVAGRVSWGFTLHCTPAELPNRLQVSWNDMDGHNSFHMEEMLAGTCSDDPTIDPGDPPAPFDTHTGEGIGRFNGQPGHATWIFKDAGEPGGGTDRVELHVEQFVTGKHITVVGFIKRGNHQAHPSGGA